MISIQLDERKIEQIFLEELKKHLNNIEHRTVFWDMKELCKQTKMSENNLKDKFFYDQRFPKFKVGGKWFFPAVECELFLLNWIKEQKMD